MMLPYWHDSPDPVPGSERAVCGHPAGCSWPPCVKQRARIAAGKADAAELVRQERARRLDGRAVPGLCGNCRSGRAGADGLCLPCRVELALEQVQAAGTAVEVTALGDRERALVPAEPAAPEPPPDPAGEIEAALREFDAWYAAGKGCLPEPGPLPAGICGTCRLSKAVTNGRCFWCDLADAVRQENLARSAEAAAAGRADPVAIITTGLLALAACGAVVMMIAWMLSGVMS